MQPTNVPSPPGENRPPSAVAAKLLDRKIRRYLQWGVVGFVLFPLAMIALFALTDNFGFQATGMVGLLLFGLLVSAGAVIVPIGFAVLLIMGIRNYYRNPQEAAGESSAPVQVADAATGLPSASAPQGEPIDLALLEELRGRLAKASRRRVAIYVPIALILASGIFYSGYIGKQSKSSGSPVFAFVILYSVLGVGAWGLAISGPRARYATAFKTDLFPRLLKPYGDLRYTVGTVPDLARLRETGMMPDFDSATADDAIEGAYCSFPLRITELCLTKKAGKNTRDVFRGLLIDLAVDTRMLGVTVVSDNTPDAARRERALGLQNIRLEDPVFNNVYRVSGNDQVEARAVLNPAVMERLLVMADGRLFFPPRFLLEGHRMSFALHQQGSVLGLFEPPAIETHTAAQQLAAVRSQLAEIFALVDAMIDMRIAYRPHAGASTT
jgi:hypothetical protein